MSKETKKKSGGKSRVSKMQKKIEAFFRVEEKTIKTGKYNDYLLTRFDKPIKLADFMTPGFGYVGMVFKFLDSEHTGACQKCDNAYTAVIISDLERAHMEPDYNSICYCETHLPPKYKDELSDFNGRKYAFSTEQFYIIGTLLNDCGIIYLLIIDKQGNIDVFDNRVEEEHRQFGLLWKLSDRGNDTASQKTIKDVHDAIEENL